MSTISTALAQALAAVATARGESLSYRAAVGTGSYIALSGFVLDRDEIAPPFHDEQQAAEETVRSGRLCGPLTPVLTVGMGIRDGNNQEWAIETAELDQQQLCTVRRTTVANAGPNRGGDS
ncbi:hypothetical protein [Methylibium sp.]|uniref:hypothetical protein n=1 Tax=Methylibium sp. TaxID=2067992 RepID=UPI0017CBD8C7|nr:hypothetical protein [Methylibium sp.]MBA3591562.1 hypothetical protein [Methylibium sp.]